MKKVLFGSVILLWASLVSAQTAVLNPKVVEFQVSADHNLSVVGTPVVAKYELRIFAEGASAPMTTSDLGKPTAADNATVTIDRTTVLAAIPVGSYFARVAAVGPGGEGVSDPSNPFGRVGLPSAARSVVLR